jgi:chorismate--pyruvate lyase
LTASTTLSPASRTELAVQPEASGATWRLPDEWGARVPERLRPWLEEPGLLTARVRAASGGRVQLRLLGVRTAAMLAEWRSALDSSDADCRLREIEFADLVRGRRWIFAQTVFPDSTLIAHPWLADLGGAGLGQTLAGRDDVRREPLRFACLDAAQPLLADAGLTLTPDAEPLWARRAVYRIDGWPLLVQELFLPGLDT